ncbi:MAG: MBL fold metallo-hydrolase [Verrucomicrobiales bacterium]|nr:MBL fold metallo-hydrolase [Verrucomicrobiales bacterium]
MTKKRTSVSAKKKATAKKKTSKSTAKPKPKRKTPTAKKPKRTGYSQIVLLGTGNPGPDPDKCGPSLAIVVNDVPYIVDFGPGVVRRAAAAVKLGVTGLAPNRLTRAFLTHLHSDHTTGYPDLIFTPWVCGRDEPLQVYGPKGLAHMTDHILAAYEADIDQRLNGLEPANDQGYQVDVKEIKPGLCYEDENVEVHAFAVSHGSWPCYGYKFICPDRTIVISGDTCLNKNVAKHAKGCDVLIHEVCSGMGLMHRSPEWQQYHSNYHTLGFELGELASKAKPGLLVLVHQLLQGVSEADLLREVRSSYSGAVVSGKDLDIL